MPVFNLTEQSMDYSPSEPSARQLASGRLDTTFSGGIGSQDYGRFLEDKPMEGGRRRRTKARRTKARRTKARRTKARKGRKTQRKRR
uniref:Uncharacterized protein n=1 Tax=viral metagenome TaxID=1070528 RepID=A0A6C0K1L9_9ZZZZ